MGTVNHYCNGEYRNDGWTLAGSGVTQLQHCWGQSGVDDTKYAKCPASKGCGSVSFPIDITSVPDGAVITSITIRCRCAKTTTASDTITIQLTCSDDTSKWLSRTLSSLTTTPTDFEVGTYQFDPLGRPWDRDRINKILCKVFSYCGVFDHIRCYRLYCVINYRVRPTVVVTAPSGTVYTSSPVISWTYTQTDGDPQKRAHYKLFTAVQQAQPHFNPETTAPVFDAVVQGDVSSVTLPTSINPDDYWVYVRVTSSFGAKSIWVGKSFSVQGPAPAVPGNDNAGAGGTPGVGTILVVPDSYNSAASLTFRDASNLLSVNQADYEIANDALGSTTTNCTIVRDSTVAFGSGLGSLRLTASSAATMSALTSFIEIQDSAPVTIRAQFEAKATGRTVNLVTTFYDMNYTALGGTITATGTDVTTGWKELVGTGTTPAGTAFAKIKCEVASPANAEIHYVDRLGLMYGTNSAWSDGGHMSRNLLSSFQAVIDDPTTSGNPWITANSATSVARVTAAGTGFNGSHMAKMTYNGLTPTIAFRATSTVFTSPTSGANFTLNKPAGTVDGDLLIAYVTCADQVTGIIPPVGWTLVNQVHVTTATGESMFILKRNGLTADPSTWTDGVLNANSSRRTAVVVGYSGAADITSQFVAENIKSDSSGALVHTTATVNNTVGNAWRLCAFAYRDGVTGGSSVANIAPPSTVPPIAFVAAASPWSTTATTTSFTINKPTGVISGDLMIATVGISNATAATITAPSGWTVVEQFTATNTTASARTCVMKRTAGASEPSSWAGTLSASVYPIVTQVSAYRNCDTAANQFIAEDKSTTNSGSTSITTASVSNTNSGAWRVCAFVSSQQNPSSISSTEVKLRSNNNAAYTTTSGYHSSTTNVRSSTVGMFDSNGVVSTGSHSRTGTISNSTYGVGSWIGIIKPLPSPPAPGANETERLDNTNGSSNPWQTLALYDSGGVVAAGNTSVTGVFTPGSGSDTDAILSWIGIIKPADPVVSGTVESYLTSPIDFSTLDPRVLELCGHKVSLVASFIGSTGGTPYLTVDFYNGNELILTNIAPGDVFNATTFTKAAATFAIPANATRMRPRLGAKDRAVNDTVSFDCVGLMLGETSVFRSGTSRAAHPVWATAQIQYQEDDGTGYSDWQDLHGQFGLPPSYDDLSGASQYTDETVIPLIKRRYRIQTVSYGLAGDKFVSGYGPPSEEVVLTAANWWLKDLRDPSQRLLLRVRPSLTVGTTNTATLFQPLGEDYPNVVTEGYKSDVFSVTLVVDQNEFSQLRGMLSSGKTLFLQSDVDYAWWVRPVGDLDADLLPTGRRKVNPLRFVKVTFAQVKPEP